MLPTVYGMVGVCHNTHFFCCYWDVVLWTFLPCLAWNCDPPSSSLPCSWDGRLPCQAVGWHRVFCLCLQSSRYQFPKELEFEPLCLAVFYFFDHLREWKVLVLKLHSFDF
jgi:hypothetical protein